MLSYLFTLFFPPTPYVDTFTVPSKTREAFWSWIRISRTASGSRSSCWTTSPIMENQTNSLNWFLCQNVSNEFWLALSLTLFYTKLCSWRISMSMVTLIRPSGLTPLTSDHGTWLASNLLLWSVRRSSPLHKNKTQRSTMRPQATFSFFIFLQFSPFFTHLVAPCSSSLLPPRCSFLLAPPSSSSLLPPCSSFFLVSIT